ncbi:MAG TPA: hypothetical protein VNM22_05585 [Candidatus Limnocylindrales bacterium]|nr:hypothetical protein [Candidatus Limnocylindrales bacterium]
MVEFIPKQVIQKVAEQDLWRYRSYTGDFNLEFPLNVGDVFQRIFGLQIDFIDLTQEESLKKVSTQNTWGGLYPEKCFFQGKDKVILINTGYAGMTEEFCRFAIAHAGGHYALHYRPEGAFNAGWDDLLHVSSEPTAPLLSGPLFCNPLDTYHPLEIQASYYAAAILVPRGEIFRLTGGPNLLNLYHHENELCHKFGVSRQILELRLQHLEAELEADRRSNQRFYSLSESAKNLGSIEKLAP